MEQIQWSSAVAYIMTLAGLQAMPLNYDFTWSRALHRGNILSWRNSIRLYGPLSVWVDHIITERSVIHNIKSDLEVRKVLYLLLQLSRSEMPSRASSLLCQISTADVQPWETNWKSDVILPVHMTVPLGVESGFACSQSLGYPRELGHLPL